MNDFLTNPSSYLIAASTVIVLLINLITDSFKRKTDYEREISKLNLENRINTFNNSIMRLQEKNNELNMKILEGNVSNSKGKYEFIYLGNEAFLEYNKMYRFLQDDELKKEIDKFKNEFYKKTSPKAIENVGLTDLRWFVSSSESLIVRLVHELLTDDDNDKQITMKYSNKELESANFWKTVFRTVTVIILGLTTAAVISRLFLY